MSALDQNIKVKLFASTKIAISVSDDVADVNDKDRKKKRKLDVKDVFNNDDDDSLQPKQKRKLVPIGKVR